MCCSSAGARGVSSGAASNPFLPQQTTAPAPPMCRQVFQDQWEIVKEIKDTIPVLKNLSSSREKQNIHICTKQLKNKLTEKPNQKHTWKKPLPEWRHSYRVVCAGCRARKTSLLNFTYFCLQVTLFQKGLEKMCKNMLTEIKQKTRTKENNIKMPTVSQAVCK